jgi:hypothetical protein
MRSDPGVPFQLGGSGMLMAHGIEVEVRDLDLVVPGRFLALVLDAFSGTGAALIVGGRNPFCSDWLVRGTYSGVPCDVIGGLAIRDGSRIIRFPFRDGGGQFLGGTVIPTAPIGQWQEIYRRYRPDRARQLARIPGSPNVGTHPHDRRLYRREEKDEQG